jgi:hypothetical protein
MTSENTQNQSPTVGTTLSAAVETATETPAVVTTSQVIRKAAEILAHKGWCQQSYEQGGRVCATMALYEAERHLTGSSIAPQIDPKPISLKAMDYMRKFTGALSLPTYNDMYSTTLEDVLLLFKRAAELAEAQRD